jgi:hypothetical protein
MANAIPQRQNEMQSIQLLAAERRLYGWTKYLTAAQVSLVVLLPAALIVAESFNPALKLAAAAVGLTVAVLDVAVFDRLKGWMQERAAAVQELFDCRVLDLPWPRLKSAPPDWEDVDGLATGQDVSTLRDWYPVSVGSLPMHAARVTCQRSNCRWDSKLRSYFRAGLIGFALLLLGAAILAALIRNLTFSDFVLALMAPVLPIALWAFREADRHAEAAARADRLKAFGDELWEEVLQQSITLHVARSEARRFQDEVYEHRRQSPVVFDWFYRLLRSRFEMQMQHSAEEMIAQAEDLPEPAA